MGSLLRAVARGLMLLRGKTLEVLLFNAAHPDYPDDRPDLQFLGYWKSLDRRRTRDPDPHPSQFVDETWSLHERSAVVAYLRGGQVLYTWIGSSTCRFCGLRPNGRLCLTDGVYGWPEGLAHAVECHGVRPPEAFVAHALKMRQQQQPAEARPPPGGGCELQGASHPDGR